MDHHRYITANDLQAFADRVTKEIEKLAVLHNARLVKAETEIAALKGGISMVASALAKVAFDRDDWNEMMDRCGENIASNGTEAALMAAETIKCFKIIEADDGFRPIVIKGGKSVDD
jgi:Xaa-Pro aminopeptidase